MLYTTENQISETVDKNKKGLVESNSIHEKFVTINNKTDSSDKFIRLNQGI